MLFVGYLVGKCDIWNLESYDSRARTAESKEAIVAMDLGSSTFFRWSFSSDNIA
jgi:hypothetical protein